MRSHGKGSMSATTQVKVSSLETTNIALGQGFHHLETNIGTHVTCPPYYSGRREGESVSDVPGSESVAGKRIVYIGTWENRSVPTCPPFHYCRRAVSFQEAEEATRKYGVSVVGLTHSRSVGRVMPVESRSFGIFEGVGSLTQRDRVCHAIH